MGRMQEKTGDTWSKYGGDGENCFLRRNWKVKNVAGVDVGQP